MARAARVYRTEWCKNTFEEDLAWHLEHGYVLSTPGVFLMGCLNFDDIHGWHWRVSLMAGNLLEALSLIPFPLRWVAFERKNVLKFYKLDNLYDKIAKLHR